MPSSIAPIEQTRGFAVRPAMGLRFGNFEGVVNLPPVKGGSTLGCHSYAVLNNQQICRTVCEWAHTWQPWQQKVLLYSIVNRCTLPQLEILATTLEPLRHRDPLNASRRKQQLLPQISHSVKNTPSIQTRSSYPPPESRKVSSESSIPQKPPPKVSKESSATSDGRNAAYLQREETPEALNLDQYAGLVSSSIVVAAIGEIYLNEKADKILKRELSKAELNLESLKSHAENKGEPCPNSEGAPDQLPKENSKLSSPGKDRGDDQLVPVPPANTRPGILRSSSGKRADRSRNASAQFFGSRISFTPQSRQSPRIERLRSGSSKYRHSAFASSAASTPDFFFRDKISVLGPMQRMMRTGRVQKPRALGNIPVSMQRFYKNRSFWPLEPPDDFHLLAAQKRELTTNFREQLAAIYEWMRQWESHERLSLLKDVVKLCNSDVLEALVIYLHQKLRDILDINRLSDKLLLYVFSFLPPSDINNAAKVCRRWRYLCATDDLWIVKCLELGEDEGIDNITQMIESANTVRKGVDWMLAYMELHALVQNMRQAEARSIAAKEEYLSKTSEDGDEADGLKRRGLSKRFRIRRFKDRKGEPDDAQTTADQSDQRKEAGVEEGAGESIRDKANETDSRLSEEDLSALMGDDISLMQPEISRKQPGWSKRNRRSIRSRVKHRIQETVSEKSGSPDKSGRESEPNRSLRSGVQPEEEDTALDIHTDLSQSKDLLGRVIPSMSLEWQTPEHEDDFIRYPVYAGKVTAVQRVRKVQGHIGGIQCLQFDQRRLITGGADRCTRLWDVRSGRSVHKFYGHKGGVRCVKFDNEILVTGSWDSVIFVWNIRKFTRAALLHGHDDSVSCLQLHRNYVISGSHDHTVRVWSRPTYMCTLELKGHSGPVVSLEVDEEHVYSTATDMTIRMTDLLTGMCERVFERTNSSIIRCLFLNGSLLLGGDGEGKVFFWNTATGEAEAAVKVHDAAVNTIHYHNGRFYTGSDDGTMTEYDLMTMTCLRVLRGHKGAVKAIQVTKDMLLVLQKAANYSHLESVRELKTKTLIVMGDLPCVNETFTLSKSLAIFSGISSHVNSDGDLLEIVKTKVERIHQQVSDRRFVSCSDDGSIRIWDLHTDKTTSLSSVF